MNVYTDIWYIRIREKRVSHERGIEGPDCNSKFHLLEEKEHVRHGKIFSLKYSQETFLVEHFVRLLE